MAWKLCRYPPPWILDGEINEDMSCLHVMFTRYVYTPCLLVSTENTNVMDGQTDGHRVTNRPITLY